MNLKIDFDNTYARLPEQFYQRIQPSKIRKPNLIKYNEPLAQELGLDFSNASHQELSDIFSGNKIIDGSDPMAQVYAGYQFWHFNPQLGDGRAILLGEVKDKKAERRDIQLKWSGRTRFSRWGDGKAPLWAVIREYILSEAMNALGVPTTRSLAMVATNERVYRETVLPGAVLTRVASSHIRVGTFEYFFRKGDDESVKKLADYTIERHYPEVKKSANKYLSFFEQVWERQIKLVANWMHIWFIHGVMNTDNTTISWETIDYGPCAFMDEYKSKKVLSSIDIDGRYSFQNQSRIIRWNLARFWECLFPLIDPDADKAIDMINNVLEWFEQKFDTYFFTGMLQKIGIQKMHIEDKTLINTLLDIMEKNSVDFTLFFRYLSDWVEHQDYSQVFSLFQNENEIKKWISQWKIKLKEQKKSPLQIANQMKQVNPVFIPRNHRVQQAIDAAVYKTDFVLVNTLIDILSHPYADQPNYQEYMNPPKDDERVHQTFCGT